MSKRPLSDVPTSELPALVEQGMPVLDYVQEVKRRDECQDKHVTIKTGLTVGLLWAALLGWAGVILVILVTVWESNESLFTRLAAATLVIFVNGVIAMTLVSTEDDE